MPGDELELYSNPAFIKLILEQQEKKDKTVAEDMRKLSEAMNALKTQQQQLNEDMLKYMNSVEIKVKTTLFLFKAISGIIGFIILISGYIKLG
jgi:seryl-tRNA synthetase